MKVGWRFFQQPSPSETPINTGLLPLKVKVDDFLMKWRFLPLIIVFNATFIATFFGSFSRTSHGHFLWQMSIYCVYNSLKINNYNIVLSRTFSRTFNATSNATFPYIRSKLVTELVSEFGRLKVIHTNPPSVPYLGYSNPAVLQASTIHIIYY